MTLEISCIRMFCPEIKFEVLTLYKKTTVDCLTCSAETVLDGDTKDFIQYVLVAMPVLTISKALFLIQIIRIMF